MILITDKHECCGCEACVQACTKQCISFEEDVEGFRYPLVDKSKCINCGLCDKVCPVLNHAEEQVPLKVYAAKNKIESELLSSSSGGLFIVIAKKVISEGGVVFGAKFDDDWNVVHAFVETEEGIRAFMTSKYVQSRIGNTYCEAKKFLKSGRKVLFSGTPCQIAGLKRYLRRDYDNLLTVDIICHGVPSPMVWRRYLDGIKQNARQGENSVSSPLSRIVSERDTASHEADIIGISFRDKRLGWKKFSFVLTLVKASADGKQNTVSFSHIHSRNPYMRLFLKNLILRPSCYYCPVKSGKSHSDLTIADFWKIEKIHPECDDNRGVGLLLVNTSKGNRAIDKNLLYMKESSVEALMVSNPVFAQPIREPLKRSKCFQLFNTTDKTVEEIARLLFQVPLHQRILKKLKFIFKP